METGLEGKPWYVGAAVGVGLGILIYLVGLWQLIGPINEEIERQERQLTSLQEEIVKGRAAQARLPQFREEVQRLELELDRLLRILPSRRNTPELLRRVRALTEQGDFELKKFAPGNFVRREFYSEWPIVIELDGTYHNLARFFEQVSRFPRILNVDNLDIAPLRAREAGPHTISASFRAMTFVYLEPAPEAEDGNRRGTGGRR